MAKAIRSSPGAILRWRSEARSSSRAEVTRAFESLYEADRRARELASGLVAALG